MEYTQKHLDKLIKSLERKIEQFDNPDVIEAFSLVLSYYHNPTSISLGWFMSLYDRLLDDFSGRISSTEHYLRNAQREEYVRDSLERGTNPIWLNVKKLKKVIDELNQELYEYKHDPKIKHCCDIMQDFIPPGMKTKICDYACTDPAPTDEYCLYPLSAQKVMNACKLEYETELQFYRRNVVMPNSKEDISAFYLMKHAQKMHLDLKEKKDKYCKRYNDFLKIELQ